MPKERADRAFQVLEENGNFAGVIRATKNGPFLALSSTARVPGSTGANVEDERSRELADSDQTSNSTDQISRVLPETQANPEHKKQLFVAHGRNHKPLEDLKKILNEFKIPYKVAIDEANKGRPISRKVAALMHECSAGIFIFTKDEKFFREGKGGEHEEIWRPSENVVYELGAASIKWEQKIIIMREDGVTFPSDFSDLGYITFKNGEISSKALEIVKELIALELVKPSAA